MSLSDQYVAELSRGTAYSFADWPNPSVPTFGAGVYTIWHNDGRFIYVGMSGRGITAETVRRNTPPRSLYSSPKPCERTPQRRPVLRLRSRPTCPPLSPQGGIKWMHSCANTFMRIFLTVS